MNLLSPLKHKAYKEKEKMASEDTTKKYILTKQFCNMRGRKQQKNPTWCKQ